MDLGLKGRVALVTGASSGIGAGIAAALAQEGARVFITSRSEARAAAMAHEIGAVGGFAYDALNLDGARGLWERSESPEILVTNTGGPPPGVDPFAHTETEWRDAYQSLLASTVDLISLSMPEMRSRGYGRVINVSSIAAREPISNLVLSSTLRAGLLAAFKTMAGHVAADGVTLNTILPGYVDTPRLRAVLVSEERVTDLAATEIPAQRLATPAEIGALASFLASPQAGYITGSTTLVDGGLSRSI